MNFRPWRVGILLTGDRLAVAAVVGGRLDAFTVQAEQPAVALRAELDARRVPARSVALGLARNAVSVKQIELPPVPGDMREMVRFELERHLPFPAEDAPFDFLPLPAEPATETPAPAGQRVLIAAVDRRVADAALRLAEEARLRPWSLTVAVHNLLALVRVPRGRRIAWVHRASGTAELLMLHGDAILMSRSLPESDDAAVADELRRSVQACRWRGCDAIWLSGDSAAPGVPTTGPLSALGAPLVNPPWTVAARAHLAALPAEERGVLTLALAVALSRTVRPLELLPPALRPRRLSRSQLVTLGMLALTMALGVVALLSPGWRVQRHLARLNAEIARVEPEVKAVESVVRELDRKRKLLETVDNLEGAALRPLPVLRDLTDILPADAWLTTVSLDAKGVELTGQASAASTLIPLLENSSRFERVEFSSPVTRGRDNKEQFRIRAAWEQSPSRPAATAAAPPPPPRRPAPSAPPGGRP